MGSKHAPAGEKSRFRFILFEGEIAPGELQQFAQTFAAAVRPPQIPAAPRLAAPARPTPIPAATGSAETPDLFTDVEPDGDQDAGLEPLAPPVPKASNGRPKKLRTPKAVPGLEFTSGAKSLKDFLDEWKPEGDAKRYLAMTLWLREHRKIEEVGADHIYSCYRALGSNVPDDVLAVFRYLKRQAWVDKGSKRGLYKINHIGEGHLNTKGAS